MKLLWVKSDFLHPTTKGGRIRTLEMLKRLHARHEVHYVGLIEPGEPEGPQRAGEYSSKSFPIEHRPPDKTSLRFVPQLAGSLFSPLPLAISRWRSGAMRRTVEGLICSQRYDRLICDFLVPAVNIGDLSRWALFQHNVESMIWERHAEQAGGGAKRWYYAKQAERMQQFEADVCRAVDRVIAVSRADAEEFEKRFGLAGVQHVPTGVDVDYFRRPAGGVEEATDLVFVGSMDWMPNVDAMEFFVAEILPLIRGHFPGCRLAIVGRRPTAAVQALAVGDGLIHVTGGVPDVRPYLWGAKASVVPLRIGGGTRLKIYEAMAAGTPVVSTSIGAEGLDVEHPHNIRLADTAAHFAEQCIDLLEEAEVRRRLATQAEELVRTRFSWEQATEYFEQALGM